MNGLQTNLAQLKLLVEEYKEQLRRMKVDNVDTYPIMLNIKNETGIEDEWEFVN